MIFLFSMDSIRLNLIFKQAEKFLDKSMKFESSNKAQNLLYKLDTMRRRDAEQAKEETNNPGASKSSNTTSATTS
jgi:hypothetical protein